MILKLNKNINNGVSMQVSILFCSQELSHEYCLKMCGWKEEQVPDHAG